MISRIYPTELQLDKANSFDTEAPFLALFHLKFMINRMIVNFQFFDGDVPFMWYIFFAA